MVLFAALAPCAEALVVLIIASEMAVLGKPLLIVATKSERDYLIVAHDKGMLRRQIRELVYEVW